MNTHPGSKKPHEDRGLPEHEEPALQLGRVEVDEERQAGKGTADAFHTYSPAAHDARTVIHRAVGGVLFNVSNFPERAQSRLLGSNMGPLNEKITDAVVSALAQALTPTDDEREALAAIIEEWSENPPEHAAAAVLRWMTERGFRRSEVPEPSTEEWAARVHAAREKAIAKGFTPEHDAKHGIRHLLRWSIDYARRGRTEDSAGLVAAAIDLADVAYAELERLRHVADTRAVSEALRTRYTSDSQAAYFMRQIDTALEALPEQGEPSDAQVEAALNAWYASGNYRANEGMRRALRAASAVTEPLIECSHWTPGKITLRRGCTACAAVTEQGERS